jgi:dTDP-4-dehydrorhamnose reductase
MTEKPFVHKKAFSNIRSSFAFHDFVAEIVPNILNKRGVINIGGKRQSIYQFAKKQNYSVKKIVYKKDFLNIQKDSSININKLKKIINVKY